MKQAGLCRYKLVWAFLHVQTKLKHKLALGDFVFLWPKEEVEWGGI